MILFPPAKINIGLYITEKRNDGFHNLESAFFHVPWTDILEITPSSDFEFVSTGIPIPGNPTQNLCVKAFRLLQDAFKIPNACIHLHKILPMGAGLGGGSADAAYTLIGLRDVFNLPISNQELIPFAQQLGSDCAFFLMDKPQFGTGKGDEMVEIHTSLQGHYGLFVYPNVGISTQEAYAGVHPKKAPNHLPEALQMPIESWKNTITNDFEDRIFPQYPLLKKIKETLYEMGAVYAAMSGSGSTLFGIFNHKPADELFQNQGFITKVVEF